MYSMSEVLREKRLIWFGQVRRRYREDTTNRGPRYQYCRRRYKKESRQTKGEMGIISEHCKM